jgi:hypothetical protein
VPRGLALSYSEKAEAMADSLEAQFQPMNDPLDPAAIEVVNEAMRAYEYAPASEPKSARSYIPPRNSRLAAMSGSCKCYLGTLVKTNPRRFGFPLFVDQIRALTWSFDSELADAGNPFVRQI